MIETERLRLRVPGDADVDAWTAILGDHEVARYLGPPLDTREAVAAHVRWIRELHAVDGFGPLAVERKSDERVIGRSGFLAWDTSTWQPSTLGEAGDRAEVEIGWTLARDCWGLGYATEAGGACRDHAFAALGLDRIVAVIHPENIRSLAVARRLDMQHERDIRVAQQFESQLWVVSP
jgi:RimJ/RimL family protein N-acetyltransferase